MRTNNLIHLDYPLDEDQIFKSVNAARKHSQPYTDLRYPDLRLDNWHIKRYTDEYIESIIKDFEVEGRPRFYWLEPYAEIPEHTDNDTLCSINLIVTKTPAPITIQGANFVYQQALLNTTIPHSVKNGPVERIMLKISIFNESFEDLAKRIKYKK